MGIAGVPRQFKHLTPVAIGRPTTVVDTPHVEQTLSCPIRLTTELPRACDLVTVTLIKGVRIYALGLPSLSSVPPLVKRQVARIECHGSSPWSRWFYQ